MPEKAKPKPIKQKPAAKPKAAKNVSKFLPWIWMGSILALALLDIFLLSLLPKQTQSLITARSEILAHELQGQSAQKLVADLNATQREQEKVEAALPTKGSLLEVIQMLESLREINEKNTFNFASEVPINDEAGFAFLPLNVTLEGSIGQTMAALTRLQQTPYLIKVDHTVMESPTDIFSGVTVRVAMRLYVREPFIEN